MKKIKFFLLLTLVFSLISGCNVFKEKDPFEDINIHATTKVDDLGDYYGIYYQFEIENLSDEELHFSIEFTPDDKDLREIIGTHKVSNNQGNMDNFSFVSIPYETVIIGDTVSVPKDVASLEEIKKKAEDFSFEINNGNYIKIYD